MWYEMIDGEAAFWTFGKSQKILNLRRDPKMTGLVESGDVYSELRGVELVGTGRIIEDFDQILHIGVQVALKYNGAAAISDEAMPFIEAQARKRLGVVLDVEQVVSWDHTKLGGSVDSAARCARWRRLSTPVGASLRSGGAGCGAGSWPRPLCPGSSLRSRSLGDSAPGWRCTESARSRPVPRAERAARRPCGRRPGSARNDLAGAARQPISLPCLAT